MGCPGRGGYLKKLMIAFYCWVKGYFNSGSIEQLRALPSTKKMSEMEAIPWIFDEETGKQGKRFQRNSFPDYDTEDFREAVRMWRDFERFGFPRAGGQYDQPALWIDIVRTMQFCADKMGVK